MLKVELGDFIAAVERTTYKVMFYFFGNFGICAETAAIQSST